MMLSLKNKTAIVTGGGSGIGKAIALLFARQGAIIHILDLVANAAGQVVKEINDAGFSAFGHGGDVTDQQQIVQLFKTIKAPDILVNNAGIAHIGNLEGTSEADFDKVFKVNVKGVYNCMFAAVPL